MAFLAHINRALSGMAKSVDKAKDTPYNEQERPRRLKIFETCELPDYDSGNIICLKSDSLMNLDPPDKTMYIRGDSGGLVLMELVDHTDISFYNSVNELILHMSIRRQDQGIIVFNSRASPALHHGLGREEVVKLERYSEVISQSDRILVHDLGDKFQIIFGLTTVHYYVKRFSDGTPKKISYTVDSQHVPDRHMLLTRIISLSVFNLSDLPNDEKETIEAHWKSSARAGRALSNATSQRRSCPLTTLSWDEGKEIRVYHLAENVLQEYAYSERKTTNKWHPGTLHKLQVLLPSNSSIAAIQWHGEIRLYYQGTSVLYSRLRFLPDSHACLDYKSGVIQQLRKTSRAALWDPSATDLKPVKNSSIAAIVWIDDGIHIRVYYQDTSLYIRAFCQDQATGSGVWTLTHDQFKHGPHLRGTPISAEVLHERPGNVRICVSWQDANSELVQEIYSETIPNYPQSSSQSNCVDGSG